MDVKVSVIMPVYNEEVYLEKCLDSVVKQTLYPIELVCIDDGSTDGSICIIQDYITRYPWIRLIRQKNQGAGEARNRGIRQAKGQFLCFLDADDYYLSENALETLYETAYYEKVPVCAGLRQVDHGTETLERDPVLRQCLDGRQRKRMLYREFQYDFDYQCYLYNKDFLSDHNLLFPNLRRFQDPPFFVQAMFYAEEFVITDVEFYCYRAGHKKIKYSGQKADDLMNGMFFDLQFAYEHDLEKLFQITVDRMNDAYFDIWYDALKNNHEEAQKKFVYGQTLADKYHLVLEAGAFYYLSMNKGCDIPLFAKIREKIRKNGNIIIYGAGDIGRKCYLYLKYTGYAGVVLWVDQYRNGEEYYGQVLSDIEKIADSSYDQILITLKTKNASEQVKRNLIQISVEENLISEWVQ